MNKLIEQIIDLSAEGFTPHYIAGTLKVSYQRVVDVLKQNELPVNNPMPTPSEAHRLAEMRHRIEQHQAFIRERELELL